MKVLVIVHQFLPQDSAGTEVYTHTLAKALQARGHDVRIYYAAKRPERPAYEMARGTFDGLPVYEVVHHREFPDFESVYKDERMEEHLRTVLDEVDPDVVHIQHLHLHSIGYIGILRERGIPVVYTLAEYLNICVTSWLAKPDYTLCDGPEPSKCAQCACRWSPLPREVARTGAPAELRGDGAGVRARPRYSLRRFLGKLRYRLRPLPYVEAVRERLRVHREELGQVDLFIAPSRFLREQFIKAGMVREDQIIHSGYGLDQSAVAAVRTRREAGPLRIGFIGAVAEHKGVDLLVNACRQIPDGGFECRIYGSTELFPEYAARLRARDKSGRVRFMGAFENHRIAEVLQEIDVLVVPSRWYENSPLSIHEAFAAGIPVIASDRGGMAELVEHEKSGLHFRLGDALDLRRQILRLLREPDLLERLRAHVPKVKTIEEDARQMEQRFEELVRGRRELRDVVLTPRTAPPVKETVKETVEETVKETVEEPEPAEEPAEEVVREVPASHKKSAGR